MEIYSIQGIDLTSELRPNGNTSIHDVLTLQGNSYEQITSSQIASTDLTPYNVVSMPSDQSSGYFTTWNTNIAKVEAYVENGGGFWQSTCNNISPETLTPGGIVSVKDFGSYNLITLPNYNLVEGGPSSMSGSSASHAGFSDLVGGEKLW